MIVGEQTLEESDHILGDLEGFGGVLTDLIIFLAGIVDIIFDLLDPVGIGAIEAPMNACLIFDRAPITPLILGEFLFHVHIGIEFPLIVGMEQVTERAIIRAQIQAPISGDRFPFLDGTLKSEEGFRIHI